jgi:hypothetical protein
MSTALEVGMLHAVIRTEHDAFHFFGEVNGYNMQTLCQHVRQSNREGCTVRLQLRIDSIDRETFETHGSKWLSSIAGTRVDIRVRSH